MTTVDIFDTHTHLNVSEFFGREAEELTFSSELGVKWHNVVGCDKPTIIRAIELAETYPNVYASIGWHPTETSTYNQATEEFLTKLLTHPKVIGLGEIGLDYYWMTDSKEKQKEVFKRQIQLSKQYHLPFIVHTRDALEDTYQVIKEVGVGECGGVIHSFSGSLEMAERFISLGLMISFSGVVTFKKALDVQEAAQKLPLDKILVETDAPYLAPVPKRGHENHTAYTRYVVEKIADLRGLTIEEVAKATTKNAKRVFRCD